MNSVAPTTAHTVRQHSLFWLFAANTIGLLLATLLLWPALCDQLAPFTYGRWTPLHLDWQLYGWCSLPLVGVLFHWIGHGPTPATDRLNRIALWSWSFALIGAGDSWLSGLSSGKIFIDWESWARPLLPAAMTILWLALVWQFLTKRHILGRRDRLLQIALLCMLFFVPPALFWASGREIYPAVNPDSGGATGASLLVSTLGIVAIYGLVPDLLGVPQHNPKDRSHRLTFWTMYAISLAVFMLIGHGNNSSRETAQQVGLAVLVMWIPLGWQFFRCYLWPATARRWLIAAFTWWLVLVISGFLFFLPAVSEHLKFTNALVAHAHLALAGLVTCFNLALINLLAPGHPVIRGFWIWQGALALHILALLMLGAYEYRDPAMLFLGRPLAQACYAVRLAAGLVMWTVSLGWLMQKPLATSKNDTP